MGAGQRFSVSDRRRTHWFHVDNVLIDELGADLGPGGIAVYVALCRYGNSSGECTVSHRTLGARLNMSRTTVRQYVRLLETAGLIEVEERFDEKGQHAHRYVLLTPGSKSDTGGGYQNLTRVKIRPTPGQKDTPGGVSESDHLKEEHLEEEQRKEDAALSLREQSRLVREISDALASGWTVRSLIDAGRLDEGVWAALKRTAIARHGGIADAR